jgi:hypothetical protein
MCRKKTQQSALKTVEQYVVGGKGKKRVIEGVRLIKVQYISK